MQNKGITSLRVRMENKGRFASHPRRPIMLINTGITFSLAQYSCMPPPPEMEGVSECYTVAVE